MSTTNMQKHDLDIPALLARLPLFSALAPEQIVPMTEAAREKRLAKGEMLFQKGDPAQGFFVVVSGQIKLAFPSAQGNEKVVEIIGPLPELRRGGDVHGPAVTRSSPKRCSTRC